MSKKTSPRTAMSRAKSLPSTTMEVAQHRASERVPDSESLLNIPLVSHAFFDTNFKFIARNVDYGWIYQKYVPINLGGFNPFEFASYHGQDSRFASWLKDPFGSARSLNADDLLVKEVLFMTHDYLHVWAYSIIDQLFPSMRVFDGPITAGTFEEYVFCHLLTEAVATVGLDYWFLCQRGVNEFCPIGSDIGSLTTHYNEEFLPEFRRFSPEFEIQSLDFFRTMVIFYCSGEFPGFEAEHLMRSPRLCKWLRRELTYGVTQRRVTRQWLAHLADEPIAVATDAWSAPVRTGGRLHKKMIDELGRLLWTKVKHDDRSTHLVLPASPRARRAPQTKLPDFQFTNIAHVPDAQWSEVVRSAHPGNFSYFFYQFLGQIPFPSFPPRMLRRLNWLMEQRDVSLVLDLLGHLPRREALVLEPRDLLIVN